MKLEVYANLGSWLAESEEAGIRLRADTKEGAIRGFRRVWAEERDKEETESFSEEFDIVEVSKFGFQEEI